ncbi:fimbrial biogenesis chaperone [Pseudomonas sp. Au-Pse12]|uniref:fimbrial biogenesis chaperone n=1 Tax=Pseudomonas sp. Au-Pse12 TaxID=2906459 RepID=UPI001E53F127|nr:molecular chaperone [Pseudomonas sp. Au-Pse12]MCE4053921.1 molecular chaperone [Pseudomonas sp. Au-Pse12]
MSSNPRRARQLLGLCLLLAMADTRAGVTAEKTRVVFSLPASESALQVMNQNPYPVVVQTWVDDGEPGSTPDMAQAPILPLPAIFHMEPGEQRNLRLIYTGEALPNDRESLFWLNLYEIPPRTSAAQPPDSTRLTVTLRTQMKVLMRPEHLPGSPDSLNQQLRFHLDNSPSGPLLRIENPTPYFATLSEIQLKQGATRQAVPGTMIAPFAEQALPLTQPERFTHNGAVVEFTRVDDDGNLRPGSARLRP